MLQVRSLLLLLGSLLLLSAGCTTTTSDFAKCEIQTTPPSAEVWMKGEQQDTTPCNLLIEQPGDYRIEIKKPGYMKVLKRVRVVKEADENGDKKLVCLPDKMTVTLDPLEGDGGGGDGGGDGGEPEKPYYDE